MLIAAEIVKLADKSLPLRGAWIEIVLLSRLPLRASRRSPCGGRGLKCSSHSNSNCLMTSLPLRGAWIEIIPTVALGDYTMSLPLRGAWIEIDVLMHTLYEG